MIVGVDIGLTGGIACLKDGHPPQVVGVIDMPTVSIKKGRGTKNLYDTKCIKDLFAKWPKPIEMVFIEKTQPLQIGYRSQASHSLGLGEGIFVGLLEGLEIPYEFVKPMIWQKHFGITKAKGDKKVQSYQVASQLFPAAELMTPRGRKLDGRSDALLIAEWGRRHLLGRAQ